MSTKSNTDGFRQFREKLPEEMKKAADEVGRRYLDQLQDDFKSSSQGGGDWAPLTIETALRRKAAAKGKSLADRVSLVLDGKDLVAAPKQRAHSILVATGTLRASLTPGKPGNVIKVIEGNTIGVEVGIGGSDLAKEFRKVEGPARKRGKRPAPIAVPADITIGQLARIHNDGLGHVPARVILRDPNPQTQQDIRAIFQAAVDNAKK